MMPIIIRLHGIVQVLSLGLTWSRDVSIAKARGLDDIDLLDNYLLNILVLRDLGSCRTANITRPPRFLLEDALFGVQEWISMVRCGCARQTGVEDQNPFAQSDG